MTVVDSHIAPSARLDDLGTHREWLRQSLWFCAACVAGFLLPFVFADVLAIRRDVYYAIYIVFVFAFFLAWARTGGTSVSSLVRRNWQWALALGGLAAAILAFIAFTFEPSAHPGGLRFAAAIAWRGVAYGAADGLLLGAFPVLAVFAVFPFRRGGHTRCGRSGQARSRCWRRLRSRRRITSAIPTSAARSSRRRCAVPSSGPLPRCSRSIRSAP